MSMESTSSRCEQLARQVLAYGRPRTTDEVVARIEAVDAIAVRDAVGLVLRGAPTLAVLGSLKNVEDYAKVKERLAA
jgi:predicted Zn-dependent peptidase